MKHKQIWRAAFAATSLAAVAMLSGCGGASNGTALLPTPASGPAVNGLDANNALGGTLFEDSGLASPDAQTAYLTGATASTAKPSSVVANQFGGTIPLGFAPDGTFGGGTTSGTSVAPGASVIFGANISGGNSTTTPIGINPNSVVLTSPEVAGFSQPLKFTTAFANQTNNGAPSPLAAAQYATAAFTLPFTTTGLHSFVASVSDASGQSSTTTFNTVVVSPSDAALYVQITDAKGNPLPGATATITGQINPAAPATQQATADGNGVVILFAKPGAPDKSNNTNTVTVTAPKHTFADTPVALTAGTVLTRVPAPTKDDPNAVAPVVIAANE